MVRERLLLFLFIKVVRASAKHHVRFFSRDSRCVVRSNRRALPARLEVIVRAALASSRSHAVLSGMRLQVADKRGTFSSTLFFITLGLCVVQHGSASVLLLPCLPSPLQVEDGDAEDDEDANESGYDTTDDFDRGRGLAAVGGRRRGVD